MSNELLIHILLVLTELLVHVSQFEQRTAGTCIASTDCLGTAGTTCIVGTELLVHVSVSTELLVHVLLVLTELLVVHVSVSTELLVHVSMSTELLVHVSVSTELLVHVSFCEH